MLCYKRNCSWFSVLHRFGCTWAFKKVNSMSQLFWPELTSQRYNRQLWFYMFSEMSPSFRIRKLLIILKLHVISLSLVTILVKSPWDTRRKYLTQLPVVSYCYQIIVLSTHYLAPCPLSLKSMLSKTCTKIFSPTATLSRGEWGDGLHFYTGHEIFSLS